jgi:hypothetical protein
MAVSYRSCLQEQEEGQEREPEPELPDPPRQLTGSWPCLLLEIFSKTVSLPSSYLPFATWSRSGQRGEPINVFCFPPLEAEEVRR